jgi:hypothetical protein
MELGRCRSQHWRRRFGWLVVESTPICSETRERVPVIVVNRGSQWLHEVSPRRAALLAILISAPILIALIPPYEWVRDRLHVRAEVPLAVIGTGALVLAFVLVGVIARSLLYLSWRNSKRSNGTG